MVPKKRIDILPKNNFVDNIKIGGLGVAIATGLVGSEILNAYEQNNLRNSVPSSYVQCSEQDVFPLGSDENTALNNYVAPAALSQYGQEMGFDATADVNPELASRIKIADEYLGINGISPLEVTLAQIQLEGKPVNNECVKKLTAYLNQ